jgi:protein arginine N-methyltransferase 1
MSLLVDEHRAYLADGARLDAYARAIAAVVRPGDVVLDLGAGTGILGLLACRAGAARVYAVEEGDMIEVARRLARANGFDARIVHLRAHSSHVTLPEPVDVVVCDQSGRFGVDGSILEDLDDVRRRLVKAGGRFVPSSIAVALAPVESPEAFAAVAFWESRPAGFDVAAAREVAANTGYPRAIGGDELVAPAVVSEPIDLTAPPPRLVRIEAQWTVARAAMLHGLAAWFSATLAPGVVLTNSPVAPDRINRRHVFFPIDRPVALSAGDEVHASMRVMVEDVVVSWQVAVQAPGAAAPRVRFAHSTLQGMLLDRSTLEGTRPGHVPRLTARGLARRTVLELADGVRTLAEIERAVLERHADLFRRPEDAAVFVADVMARNAE